MTKREETIIRVVGLMVHALGFVGIVAGVLVGSWALGMAAVLAFVVGGGWGWGMVLAVSRRDAQERSDARSDAMARERMGQVAPSFTARFDDMIEPPPVPRTLRADVPD